MAVEEKTYDLFSGVDTVHNPADIPQVEGNPDWDGLLRFNQSNNAFQPQTRRDLMTRPGMADVRSTAINASAILTGLFHQGDLADNFLLTASISGTDHDIYQDSANPPVAIAGGSKFTIGQNNFVWMMNFTDGTNQGTIAMSRLRDTPQFLTSSLTRSNFSITSTLLPYAGEVFGQRALYIRPSVSGTVYLQRVYWTDLRNGSLLTDASTQFDSFETEEGGSVNAVRRFGEVVILGLTNNVFLGAVSPSSKKPFAFRELPSGKYKGPISQNGLVIANQLAVWMSQTSIHTMNLSGQIEDIGDIVKPTIAGLQDNRREFTVSGYDAKNDLALFGVTSSGGSTHDTVIAVNLKTKAIYPNWTLSVNAMGQRMVSGQQRLIMGGYVGKFRNWDSGTTGNADNASSAIDMDTFTPRHHVGRPDWVKLWWGVKVTFDPQASEAVTLQYRLNDASAWSSFGESPYSVVSTAGDENVKFFRLMKAGTHLQLRYRDNNSGETFRVQKYTLVYEMAHPALVN